ncbi:unnamed protein product, partial [Ilex paraguariensis]
MSAQKPTGTSSEVSKVSEACTTTNSTTSTSPQSSPCLKGGETKFNDIPNGSTICVRMKSQAQVSLKHNTPVEVQDLEEGELVQNTKQQNAFLENRNAVKTTLEIRVQSQETCKYLAKMKNK